MAYQTLLDSTAILPSALGEMPPILFRDFVHQLIVAPLAMVCLLRRDPIVPHSVESMSKISSFQRTL
jgi:hypothetical protein